MYPQTIQKLIELFSKFPGVGPKTAARFVFYLIKIPLEKFNEFSETLTDLRRKTKICPLCFYPFEGQEEFCPICENKDRNKEILCVVEKESDLESIEKTKKYKGVYFVLNGTISGLKKDKENIRIEELKKRVKEEKFKEVIIATNPTVEGEITALLIERELKPLGVITTRLGRGLPMGGELEYADEETIISALEQRK